MYKSILVSLASSSVASAKSVDVYIKEVKKTAQKQTFLLLDL